MREGECCSADWGQWGGGQAPGGRPRNPPAPRGLAPPGRARSPSLSLTTANFAPGAGCYPRVPRPVPARPPPSLTRWALRGCGPHPQQPEHRQRPEHPQQRARGSRAHPGRTAPSPGLSAWAAGGDIGRLEASPCSHRRMKIHDQCDPFPATGGKNRASCTYPRPPTAACGTPSARLPSARLPSAPPPVQRPAAGLCTPRGRC